MHAREPVHVLYGGAHLFRVDTAEKMGRTALAWMDEHGKDPLVFARKLGMRCEGAAQEARAKQVHALVLAKLQAEPVEDLRLDFEDGYGVRPDAEEDGHAASSAEAMAQGLAAGTLPPFIGIRIKALGPSTRTRALRTLESFLTRLTVASGGKVPDGFIITLPKVTNPDDVRALATSLDALESRLTVTQGALRVELMVESPRALYTQHGTLALPGLVEAARGRCVGVHLGAYDYTALLGITAGHASLRHPACEYARQVMKVSLAGSGMRLSDGATQVLPVGPHRAPAGATLTQTQGEENAEHVAEGCSRAYANVRHALETGFYQGWDLHPAQLPVRYAATFAFFLEELAPAAHRLKAFLAQDARGTLSGNRFDDEASAQGLLNTFLRAAGCGACTPDDVQALTGLTVAELARRAHRVS